MPTKLDLTNSAGKYNKLTSQEEHVIVDKGTEPPFSGKYYNNNIYGTYYCKQCNAPLFNSQSQFDGGCGWPSFDDELPSSVKKIKDIDAERTEIVCAKCDGHLGHIFYGEGFTKKDTRYCVNSLSLKFIEFCIEPNHEIAYFSGGCFWGIEYFLRQKNGVINVTSGYMGGNIDNPTYEQICTQKTGHVEVVKVIFDRDKISYEELCRLFFEIHDPTQLDGQGPDIGNQYLSVIFTMNKNQQEVAQKLINILENKGFKIATKIRNVQKFWPAELYHQNYYTNNGKKPYCHNFVARF